MRLSASRLSFFSEEIFRPPVHHRFPPPQVHEDGYSLHIFSTVFFLQLAVSGCMVFLGLLTDDLWKADQSRINTTLEHLTFLLYVVWVRRSVGMVRSLGDSTPLVLRCVVPRPHGCRAWQVHVLIGDPSCHLALGLCAVVCPAGWWVEQSGASYFSTSIFSPPRIEDFHLISVFFSSPSRGSIFKNWIDSWQ